jgi:hypothetical protein
MNVFRPDRTTSNHNSNTFLLRVTMAKSVLSTSFFVNKVSSFPNRDDIRGNEEVTADLAEVTECPTLGTSVPQCSVSSRIGYDDRIYDTLLDADTPLSKEHSNS